MGKDLKDKAIDIKGKQYVLVSDRIIYFNETYPDGSIQTELVSKPDDTLVVIKATISPSTDSDRMFTGYSQAKWGDGYINKTSALENAETSAVGRALAMMGIGVIDSVASVDEINKTTYKEQGERVDNQLPELKQQLYTEFKNHKMTTPDEIKGFLTTLIGKDDITSVGEAKAVLKALESYETDNKTK